MKPCCWQYVGCELRVGQACSAGQCDDRSVAVTFVFDVSRGMTYVPHTVRVKCNAQICLGMQSDRHTVLTANFRFMVRASYFDMYKYIQQDATVLS
jgi:hypothetical protein